MTTTLGLGATFLFGFGLVFLPPYGPFIGLLSLFAVRWSLRRSDLWWWLAALLLAVPLGVTQGLGGLVFGLAQVLAPWLVFRTFEQLPGLGLLRRYAATVSLGLVSGLALLVALSWLQIEQLNFAYKTLAQAIIWERNPALYGHAILTIGALLAVLLPSLRLRLLSLGLSALGILVSGSREAAIAWLIVAVALLFVRQQHASAASRWALAALLAVMLAVAAGLGPLLGWGRVGFLVDVIPTGSAANLVRGSEIAAGDWWDAMGVTVVADEANVAGQPLTAYTVTKTGTESWLRLQQVVPLETGRTYTVSAWLKPLDPAARPGIQGWGEPAGSNTVFAMTSALDGETLRASLAGPGTLLGSGVAEQSGDWRRIWITFRYEGTVSPLHWYVGLAPDSRSVAGTSARFAGFQLEPSETLSAYTPGAATQGLGLGVARLPYWQAAWQGFIAQPWLGWGPGAFPDFFKLNRPERIMLHQTPSHPHSLPLGILFERGLLGLAGLALLLIALSYSAVRRLDLGLLIVLAAVLAANIFDYTLFYGGVIYPLAAVAGWRAATFRGATRQGESTPLFSGYAAARLALLLAAIAGLALTGGEAALPAAIFSVLLLWPLMAWREGFNPLVAERGRLLFSYVWQSLGLLAVAMLASWIAWGDWRFWTFSEGRLLVAAALLAYVTSAAIAWRLLGLVGTGALATTLLSTGATFLALTALLAVGRIPFSYSFLLTASLGTFLWQWLGWLLLSNLPPQIGLIPGGMTHKLLGLPGVKWVALDRPSLIAKLDGIAVDLHAAHPPDWTRFLAECSLRRIPLYHAAAVHEALTGQVSLPHQSEGLLEAIQLPPYYPALKRLLDLVAVVLSLPLLLPLAALVALLVRLDSPGPVLFVQERLGQGGKPFGMIKFRSMRQDADRAGAQFASDGDQRITRVGRWLRKFRLDELPQFWNVLKGEMSIIGPRPEQVSFGRQFEAELSFYAYRHLVKPGITGWAQVTQGYAAGADETRDKLAHDLYYIKHLSLWLDCLIVIKTIRTILTGFGAR
jgi:lipopolysaccharide/colanic/teichoic acid biosynthesis glycosyltransferase